MNDQLPISDLAAQRQIPLWLKLAYTAFVVVLVPVYWTSYGPTNFLYFCDLALFFTLGALWLESPLLASMPAVGILFPQSLWIFDFLAEACGFKATGMTGYMFNPENPLLTRGLSFFHFWLPILLVWLVWRLGYDRRALKAWTGLAWGLVMVCYLWMPAPPPAADHPLQPVNINYVYGLSDETAQTWMPQPLYVGLLMIVLPAGIFLPTHLVLTRMFCRPDPDTATARAAGA